MQKLDSLEVRQVETIKDLEHGVLYVSKKFETCIHLCACGCGEKTVIPLVKSLSDDRGWVMTGTDELVTLRPSILNKAPFCPNNAHYHVTENRIEWL